MNIGTTNELLRAFVLTGLFVTTTLVMGMLIASGSFQRKTVRRTRILLSILLLLNFADLFHWYHLRTMIRQQQEIPLPVQEISPWLSLVMLVTDLYIVFIFRREYRHRKQDITASSVKESLDTMPDGIIFSRENGRILLINKTMNEIGRQLSGHNLTNAVEFWDCVKNSGQGVSAGASEKESENRSESEKRSERRKEPEEQVTLRLADDRVLRLQKTLLSAGGTGMVKITTTDETQFFRLTEELSQSNRKLQEMNESLKLYNSNVVTITREREHLEMKTRIHREIGQLLMASRFAIAHRDTAGMMSVLRGWELLETSMREESGEIREQNVKEQLCRAAQAAGAVLEISGEIPAEERVASLLAAAGAEAVINAVRHANAQQIKMQIMDNKSEYLVEFRNDGRKPERPIEPGGGLSALQQKAEEEGGYLEIFSEPEFLLRVHIFRP